MIIFAQIIGLIGVAIQLVAYYLLASGRLSNNDVRYPWINIIGTSCIVFSVLYQWNLPSFVSQIVWIGISVMGLIRIRLKRAK